MSQATSPGLSIDLCTPLGPAGWAFLDTALIVDDSEDEEGAFRGRQVREGGEELEWEAMSFPRE